LTSNAATDEQYEIEDFDFDSNGAAAEKPSSANTRSMGIDDFEVTFTGTDSDDADEVRSRQQQPYDDPAAIEHLRRRRKQEWSEVSG
jgi:hypothetical protein